jgi:hypothetical protein
MRRLLVPVLVCLLTPLARAETATRVKDFEGAEDPAKKYNVAADRIEDDDFANITDVGDNAVRMFLRFRPGEWWDGDQSTDRKDRQRAEVKGIGPHQKVGETFEYGTTWRTDPDFHGTDRFCHVFQLKATDGDNGAPLVVISILDEPGVACLRYWSGDARGFTVARKFNWKPNTWQTLRIRIKTTADEHAKDGLVMVSVDGDEFQGATGIALYRPRATDYRPKWGLYRGVSKDMKLHDDWVEHKNANAQKIDGAAASAGKVPTTTSSAR